MKAHIVSEPRCVLLWRFGPGQPGYAALERAARSFRLALRPVGDAELGTTVGALCSGKPASPASPLLLVQDTPAMIVSGLRHDTGDLNAFVDAVKAGGAAFPLRAVVTPTSKGWTLAQLLQELQREHEALEGTP